MDQMSAALARPGRALLLECASLAARHIPIRGRLLLVDSGLRRVAPAGGVITHQAACAGDASPPPPALPDLWLPASRPAAIHAPRHREHPPPPLSPARAQ